MHALTGSHWLEDTAWGASRWTKSDSGRKQNITTSSPMADQALRQQKEQWTLVTSPNQLWRPHMHNRTLVAEWRKTMWLHPAVTMKPSTNWKIITRNVEQLVESG